LLFENYGQEVGGPIHCWFSNLKVGDQSLPVPTVVAPMLSSRSHGVFQRGNVQLGMSHTEVAMYNVERWDAAENAMLHDWMIRQLINWLRSAAAAITPTMIID